MKVTIGYEMDMRACADRPWRNDKIYFIRRFVV